MLRYFFFILFLIILNMGPFFLFAYDMDLGPVTYSSSSSVEEHLGLGTNYMKQGKYLKAEREFKQAIREDSKYYLGYYALGMFYLKRNRLQESISILSEGISNVGFNKRLFFGLATAYKKKGDLDNAERVLEEILEIEPDSNIRRELYLIRDLKSAKKETKGEVGFLYVALFLSILAISFILKVIKK